MSLSIGIVGLPNVGKSTLFNALLGKAQAAASNFPFCTIEPNVGTVPVPDPRLDVLAKLERSEKSVPTAIEFVDIAGLVKGASEGQGLGNQFLGHVRECDAIIEVVRMFSDNNVIHVSGTVDPKEDIATINTELLIADMQALEKRVGRETKEAKTDVKLQPRIEFLHKIKTHIDAGQPARTFAANDAEKIWLKELCLLTSKPILYVANVDEEQLEQLDLIEKLEQQVDDVFPEIIALNAKAESELAQMCVEDQDLLLKELGMDEPGLNKVIRVGYKLLNLITFFTAGPKEARAWTVRSGAKAPQAAGAIHTDFEKGFIRAETVSYTDFVQYGGWKGAGETGKNRQEGKDYLIQDGDVMLFRFNV
ncbi:MAG: redox-regulated ATPase YchF [Patescibacteria group bacterium]